MLRRKPEAESKLDDAIIRVLTEMETETPDSDEYAKLLLQLQRLTALKSKDDKGKVGADTLVTVGGNLVGAMVIVAYEQRHVWTSKALGLFFKPKL